MKSVHIGGRHITAIFKRQYVERLGKDGFESVEESSAALVDGGDILSIGRAYRSPFDVPDRLAGYKLAFGRAVERFTKDKLVRAQLWDAFRDTVNADIPF